MVWRLDGCISMQNLDVVRGDNRIAMIDCDNEALSDGDILANARLIAAAPDMLAALEAVIDDLADGIEMAEDEGATEEGLAGARARLRIARMVIAKAKGED
jgi:hypothetical protein